ncbi:MAG: sigma-54-dependent Fis family transcriptional regulator [Gemmatimonadota bacterium]|nr:MAG: sigma-54-dependent Fis family transcriptional regulator [Gemmatimonadota bacterium]
MTANRRVQGHVLLIEDAPEETTRLRVPLERQRYVVDYSPCGPQAVEALLASRYDVVILCACGIGPKGLFVLSSVRALQLDAQFIVMTDDHSAHTAVEAMKLGAFDYLVKPVNVDEMLLRVERALESNRLEREVRGLRREVRGRNPAGIIGASAGIRRVIELVEQVAPTAASVLITGETGTGKELAARAVHELSPRSECRFVPVSCASLPETLLESELFGHVRGSFTGAVANRRGLFEEAAGGTAFLDEIEALSCSLQPKLLRVIEERVVQRIGANRETPVDFRLIAASNAKLESRVEEGRFRDDLFHRLNVFPICLPPLRERPEDIPLLAIHFRDLFAKRAGLPALDITEKAMGQLMAHDWPGNIRELRNCIERGLILCAKKDSLDIDLPYERDESRSFLHVPLSQEWSLSRLADEYTRAVVEHTEGHRNRAARILGIDRRTLYRKIRELDI